MNWSWRVLATTFGVGIVFLYPVTGVFAEAEEDAPDVLNEMLGARADGNEQASEVQARIDTVSDETDELLAQYRTVLKQIESIDVYNEQIAKLISSQEEELASLGDQLERVQGVGRSVTPLMTRMIDAIDKFVELDVPFLRRERSERTAKLREVMGRADVTTPEKFRLIMEAYQIENEYGRTIEAYRDILEIDGRETTVDFLRFGRIALVYQSLDEKEVGRWDNETRSWVELDASYRSPFRNGLRIARKQTAPDLLLLPLPAAIDRRGSS